MRIYAVISIPNVESHIQAELSTSPSPTSRKVGVPAPRPPRSVAIPKRTSAPTATQQATMQVHIFDSQPLLSPSSSGSWSSKSLFMGLAKMSESNRGKGKEIQREPEPIESNVNTEAESDESDLSSRPSSIMISSSIATNSSCATPPTSIGSVTSALGKLGLSSPVKSKNPDLSTIAEGRCACSAGTEPLRSRSPLPAAAALSYAHSDSEDEEFLEMHTHKGRSHVPSTVHGPSLLTQTAPQELRPQPQGRHQPDCAARFGHQPNASSITPSPPADNILLPTPSSTSLPVPSSLPDSLSPAAPGSPTPVPSPSPVAIKIADLGNATPIDKHYTEDIQTRQYRSPEAIVGRSDWGANADIWSLACVVFELLTAEYLFDPQSQGELFGKDDDHCAQIIELLGKWPSEAMFGGRYSREIFDSAGECSFSGLLSLSWPGRLYVFVAGLG